MLRRRGKKGIFVAIAFATLALTSVGFSTWIASYQHVVETEQISITVGDVVGASNIILDAAIDDNDSTFCFDADPKDKEGPIIFSGDTGGEDLTFKFNVVVTKPTDSVFNGISLKVVPNTTIDAEYNSLITNFNSMSNGSFFNSPFKLDEDIDLIYSDGSINENFKLDVNPEPVTVGEKTTYNLQVKFTWGSLFGGDNPSHISSTASPETINAYLTNLQTLKSSLDNKSIKLIVTHPGSEKIEPPIS